MTKTKEDRRAIKAALLDMLIAGKRSELQRAEHGRKSANADAIEAEGRMLTRYDTMKDESQYLEAAFSTRIAELGATVGQLYSQLQQVQTAEPMAEIRVNSLCMVRIQRGDKPADSIMYFVVACGGGELLEHEDQAVMTIAPTAPVARLLLGKKAGEVVSGTLGGEAVEIQVMEVS